MKIQKKSNETLVEDLADETQRRRAQAQIWLTVAERDLIRRAAALCGVKFSPFLRERAIAAAREILSGEVK